MTQDRELGDAQTRTRDPLDTGVASAARVYDYLLGGKDNYEVDRAVAAALTERAPSLPVMFRAQRALLGRVVTFLARDAGIRQFLDIGTGIPTAPNVHEIAQSIARESRVLYVDNDPIVLAHARALMRGSREGRTAFVQADLREPDAILAHPTLGSTLDASRPIGLLLIGIIHLLLDDDRPYDVVHRLVDWLPSGSYIAMSTPSPDFDPPLMAALVAIGERGGIPCVPRSKPQLERFFAGLDLVDPGVVPMLAWRPDGPLADANAVHAWAGVARKP